MPFYCVKWHAGVCGTDHAEKVEADSMEEAVSMYMEVAWEWFWNFNTESDFEDVEPELDIWAEEWDEEKHGGLV